MLPLQAALIFGLAITIAYGVSEILRWQKPSGRELISPKQRRIRTWGLFLLLAVFGMAFGGTFLPTPHPVTAVSTRPEKLAVLGFMAYWTLTALLLVPLIPLALLDTRENLRRLVAERQALKREVFADLPLEPGNDPSPPASQ